HSYIYLFFYNHPAPTEIYTLSLHDALPICAAYVRRTSARAKRSTSKGSCCDHQMRMLRFGLILKAQRRMEGSDSFALLVRKNGRSEEHTSELQSRRDLVCRLLLEKKKKKKK